MPDGSTVLFLTTDFRPMTGGVAEYIHGVAQALSARVPVVVMTTAPQNVTTWAHDYQLHRLPPAPERRVGERAGDALLPIRKLRTGVFFARLHRDASSTVDDIRRLPGSARVVIGIWDVVSHFWCAACRRSGIPYAVMTHGVELIAPLYGNLPAWRRDDFQHADVVLSNSTATARLARERFELVDVPRVVYPPVPVPPPASEIARRRVELVHELKLGGGPLLLSVGRLVPRKGFDLVIRSLASLREYPGLRYVVAGDGPLRDVLDRLARDLGVRERVVMTGVVDELTKWALFDACDLFVMPNRTLDGTNWEGFGIVFVEAALAGRAAIGGRNGGVPDAVDDGGTGLLIDPEHEGELTAAIRRLLNDSVLRQRLGRDAKERAKRQTDVATADRLCAELSLNGTAA